MNAPTRLLENPRLRRLILMIALPVLLVVVGLWYWIHGERYQNTDNAYVVADQVSVAPQVTGRVTAVPVSQNQAVTPGQLLLQIDPQPFQIALVAGHAVQRFDRAHDGEKRHELVVSVY